MCKYYLYITCCTDISLTVTRKQNVFSLILISYIPDSSNNPVCIYIYNTNLERTFKFVNFKMVVLKQ